MNEAEALHTMTVAAPQAGARLDRWLAESLPALSRSRLKSLIVDGQVRIDGNMVDDPSRKVRANESIAVRVPAPIAAQPGAEAIPLTIVYEDDQLIVVDKPAGMVVHPAPGNSSATLVNALLHHCGDSLSGIGGERRPGIVHRLDKDTSGLIVAAKTDTAHRSLAVQFAAHSIDRAYKAICWGLPAPGKGEIDGRIGRSTRDRKKMAVVARGGREALTRYRVEKAFGTRAALVECRLATGRTHQIRVHMASIGHPLIGDPAYGRRQRARIHDSRTEADRAMVEFPRQALHAFLLGFTHPQTQARLLFQSNIPNDIKMLIDKLATVG
jgi:23S rRNA pseudouridine1911/1915/1917 synthase